MRLWYFHFNKWIWELGDLWLYLGALLEKAIILRIQDILVAWILPQMDDILGFHCNRYRWMCSYFYMSLIVVLFWEIHNDRHYGRVVKATDLKSVGLCPRWFKSCWCRFFFIVRGALKMLHSWKVVELLGDHIYWNIFIWSKAVWCFQTECWAGINFVIVVLQMNYFFFIFNTQM